MYNMTFVLLLDDPIDHFELSIILLVLFCEFLFENRALILLF